MEQIKSQNAILTKIETGYLVTYTYQEKMEKEGRFGDEYSYERKEFGFSTLEEAVAKIKELGAEFK